MDLKQELASLKQFQEQLRLENTQLRQKLEEALAKIKELEARLNQDSQNSNWPPSRDKGRQKRKIKNLRRQTGKSAGGQEGHEGATLAYNEEPDVIEIHRPQQCEHCAAELRDDLEVETMAKRQVLELPPLKYITIEHQVVGVRCPCCGEVTTDEFPAGITQPVQYGSSVKRTAVYLHTAQLVPYERTREALAELFGLPVSTGTLPNFVTAAAGAVEPVTTAIKDALVEAEVLHADETGCYIKGQRFWLHTASTPELSYFEPHTSRGKKATDEIGILPRFRGHLIHDNLAFYFLYLLAPHGLCNAHHLRELMAVAEMGEQVWAQRMIEFLRAAKALVEEAYEAGESELPAETLERMAFLFEAIVALGMAENPLPPPKPPPHKPGRRAKGKARNLVERFASRKAEILRFVHHFKVPFDNNLAERDIRMMKLQQKISGCFRSWEGAYQFARLRSYLSTIRKQGLSVWEALGSLFEGDILMPELRPE
jgi:transposase